MRNRSSIKAGSVLVWTVLVIAVLSVIAVETLRLVTVKYQNALQTSSWQEALLAAESGIDLAIVELRKSLYPPPNNAWNGWANQPGNNVTGYELTTVPNAGLNGTPMTIETNVDAPATLVDLTNGWQYYRIRTVGTIPITGPARAADNPQDTKLRRLSFRFERFTNGLRRRTLSQRTRTVILNPKSRAGSKPSFDRFRHSMRRSCPSALLISRTRTSWSTAMIRKRSDKINERTL